MKKSRFGIVVSHFNPELTSALYRSCVARLRRAGVPSSRIITARVPGGFEIPWAANELARSGRCDVVICLGAVLKGRTPQNDYINQATFTHIQRISIETRVPCILGVIAPKTYGQALARTRGRLDRGKEAAEAALAMAELALGGVTPKRPRG